MSDVHALYGALLVLVGFAPGNSLAPVQSRSDGVALLVLLDLVGLVAAEGRVGQAFADDAVAHPHDKLPVLGVGDFRLVHPETVYTDFARGKAGTPERVVLFQTNT